MLLAGNAARVSLGLQDRSWVFLIPSSVLPESLSDQTQLVQWLAFPSFVILRCFATVANGEAYRRWLKCVQKLTETTWTTVGIRGIHRPTAFFSLQNLYGWAVFELPVDSPVECLHHRFCCKFSLVCSNCKSGHLCNDKPSSPQRENRISASRSSHHVSGPQWLEQHGYFE